MSEVGLRLFYPQQLGVWHHDPTGLALHWPGLVTYLPQFGQTVSFNSAGMRDREHAFKKPDDAFRILLLGDSFMEALQVPFEKSFPSLLERALQRNAAKRVEVVNASVSGWGTDDELQYLTRYGMNFKPDLILVAMTLHNDISDNLRQRFHAMRNGVLVDQSYPRPSFLAYKVVQLKGFLATRSHAFQLLMRVRRAHEMQGETSRLNAYVIELFREQGADEINEGLGLTDLLLERIRVITASTHSNLALTLLPLAVQLSDSRFAEFARSTTGTTDGLQIDRPQRLATRLAERVGIPVIDLLPNFRKWTADGGGALYLATDGHWNETGHHLAANIVARELLARGLMP